MLTPGCGRGAGERAAERAVEACIAALQPVADEELPSAEVLDEATADAEEAAGLDDRWSVLAAALGRARDDAGTPAAGEAIDALVEECRRSRDFVRRRQGDSGQAEVFPERSSRGT